MVDCKKLEQEQIKLSKKVIVKDEFSEVDLIAGCDQTFVKDQVISGVIVLNTKTFEIVEKKYAVMKVKFPYISGLLFFREGYSVAEAFGKLEKKPDVLMVDGAGINHPRRIGMASQLGIMLDIPTIGVTKRLLCGKIEEEKIIIDGETRGRVVKTREHANPIYVAPGHKITTSSAVKIVKEMMKEPHKMPEPIHLAHRYVKGIRKKLEKEKE